MLYYVTVGVALYVALLLGFCIAFYVGNLVAEAAIRKRYRGLAAWHESTRVWEEALDAKGIELMRRQKDIERRERDLHRARTAAFEVLN